MSFEGQGNFWLFPINLVAVIRFVVVSLRSPHRYYMHGSPSARRSQYKRRSPLSQLMCISDMYVANDEAIRIREAAKTCSNQAIDTLKRRAEDGVSTPARVLQTALITIGSPLSSINLASSEAKMIAFLSRAYLGAY